MGKVLSLSLLCAAAATGCIDETEPQSSTATLDQVSSAPGIFDNFVSALNSTHAGQFVYDPANQNPFDFGLSSFFLVRDIMGHDIATRGDWFSYWYECYSAAYSPSSALSQFPWTCYYSWVKSCNEVLSMAGSEVSDDMADGAAQAHAIRALLYLDLAQMYAPKAYTVDKTSLTVPLVTETTTTADLTDNPRLTNEEMYDFILSDLDKAEEMMDPSHTDVYTPNIYFVYGLKARTYLLMGNWAKAEEYAKMAKEKYTMMSPEEYTSQEKGFNTPNSAWIYALKFNSDDPCILENDGDSSWGSQMCIEIDPSASGCGYAANYGQPHCIDYHLYQTIPATDCRKKCYIDFAIDNMSGEERTAALGEYTAHPDWIENCASASGAGVGGLELKFRTGGGETGRANQKIGFCVSVPVMRVEEMMLIEAEAAAWQDEARGKTLLTAFATQRDPNFEYGKHNESYGNTSTPAVVNEIWWQRRVELWGEGFAMGDIKRLNKNVIRSYTNTNHKDGYQWNTEGPAPWMTLVIVQTETNYNTACINNPSPTAPSGNSDPYVF